MKLISHNSAPFVIEGRWINDIFFFFLPERNPRSSKSFSFFFFFFLSGAEEEGLCRQAGSEGAQFQIEKEFSQNIESSKTRARDESEAVEQNVWKV